MLNISNNQINFSLKISWNQKNQNIGLAIALLGFLSFLVHTSLVTLGMLLLQNSPRDLKQPQTAPQEQINPGKSPVSQTQCDATASKQAEKSRKRHQIDICDE